MATKKTKKRVSAQKSRAPLNLAPEPANPPLRYAQPFYTSTPPSLRPINPLTGGRRISDWTSQQVGPIPAPRTPAQIDLASIIGMPGVQEIQAAGAIRIHAVGDTGRQQAGSEQEDVAIAMTADFHPDAGAQNPAFFLHLGDVIYGTGKDLLYRDEFYRPYKDYPGKIVSLAGNHDGEVFPGTDTVPCEAFLTNFCAITASVPKIAQDVGIFRETMTEPGVYWLMDAPFLQIIALYSNVVDGPGYLVGAGNDDSQLQWLKATLIAIAAQRKASRKALLITVHHPPYSSGGHSGSPAVLSGMDAACAAAGIVPDAVLSGHAHNYQRYTRRTSLAGYAAEVPFVVAGCGGHNDLPVPPATGQALGDHTYDSALRGYGYLIVTASQQRLTIDMLQVTASSVKPFDSVSVDLAANRLI